MHRREFLAAGVGGITMIAGCPRFLPAETVTIEMVQIANFDESSGHEIRLRLTDNEDVVYEGTHRLERQEGTVVPTATIDDELPDEPRRYIATAWLDEEDRPSELDVAEHARLDCAILQVAAFDTGLGIGTMDRCEK